VLPVDRVDRGEEAVADAGLDQAGLAVEALVPTPWETLSIRGAREYRNAVVALLPWWAIW
jgi:hypothetical protein